MKTNFSATGNFEVGGKRVGQSTGAERPDALNVTLCRRVYTELCIHNSVTQYSIYLS